MTVILRIYPNERLFFEIPEDTGYLSADDKPQLSLEEFDKLADELADLSMKIDGTDPQPLSDYAMSRESIYEDHPKL